MSRTHLKNRPKIGVGVIIFKGGKILLGKRKNSHGTGTWALAGGHLEFGETPETCAQREVFEETGIQIKNLRKGPYTNDVFDSENHYVTLFVFSDYASGNLEIREPEKCEQWGWFPLNDLPQPLFLSVQNLLKNELSVVASESQRE